MVKKKNDYSVGVSHLVDEIYLGKSAFSKKGYERKGKDTREHETNFKYT